MCICFSRILTLHILLLSLAGCAPSGQDSSNASEGILEGDSTFDSLVIQFRADANKHGLTLFLEEIYIEFGEIETPSGVSCDYPTGAIKVDKAKWDGPNIFDTYAEARQEQMIYHALGHCVLGQDHREDSIMKQDLISHPRYQLQKETYKKELFSY